MAEPQKATSSADGSKSKGKRSLLDDEVGKDFLSSWKSMSVTQDDAIDFNFETIPKGKKKAFDFDKLDMDFSLDGDFDKLPSFKMDLPDIDFSSPPEKTAKTNGKSKEETTAKKQQEKKDQFTFSFDFNELDAFDFDSSLTKGEKTCKKSQNSEEVALKGSEVSKIDQALEDDCIAAKLSVSKDAANSKAETPSGGTEACNFIDDPCPTKAVPLEVLAPGNMVAAQGTRISLEKTVDMNVKETNKSSPLSDRAVSLELSNQQSLHSSPMDSLSGNNSNQEPVSNMHTENNSQGRGINTNSASDENVSDTMITKEGSLHEKLHQKNAFQLLESDRDDNKGADVPMLTEIYDSQSVQSDILLKDISTSSLSREILDNTGGRKDIQNLTPELPLVSSDSEPTVSEVAARKDKEDGAIRSRYFRRSEETGKDVSSFSSKNMGDMHLCQTNEKREDFDCSEEQNGSKSVGYSDLSSQELTKGRPVLLQSENIVGSSSDMGDGFDADVVQNAASKLIDESSVLDKTAIKGVTVLVRSEKNARCSEATISEATARKDKEDEATRLRYFRRSEETKSQLHQPAPIGKEVSSFTSKKMADMHLCPTNEKRENFDCREEQNGRKSVGYSDINSQELTKGRPVLLQSENNVGSSSDIGLRANSFNHAEKTIESGIQKSLNLKPQIPKIESIQNPKLFSEASKIAKKAPALSSFKTTRTVGSNKDQLNSQRGTNSLRNLEQNKDTPKNMSKIVLPVGNAEKETPKLTSLKRKSFKESNGDLMLMTPLKRLSQSPSESRNKETSESIADMEVQNHKDHMEISTKDVPCDHLTSGLKVPQEVNMKELENDGNVEKAEACGKELEDICNMLKKKHEEAKDLLVRAFVNNNSLLMLNHPILNEKIHMVQKFAELLISKDMPT